MTYKSDGTTEKELERMTDEQRAFIEGSMEKIRSVVEGGGNLDFDLPMHGTYLTRKSVAWKPDLAAYMAMAIPIMMSAATDDDKTDVEKLELFSEFFISVYNIGHHLGEAMTMAVLCADLPEELKDLFMLKMKMAESGMFDLGG